MAVFCSFLIFYCYFTRLKARAISRQNMGGTGNITHIVFGTMHMTQIVFIDI